MAVSKSRYITVTDHQSGLQIAVEIRNNDGTRLDNTPYQNVAVEPRGETVFNPWYLSARRQSSRLIACLSPIKEITMRLLLLGCLSVVLGCAVTPKAEQGSLPKNSSVKNKLSRQQHQSTR